MSHRSWYSLAFLMGILAGAPCTPSWAMEANSTANTYRIDIDAQPLQAALDAWRAATGQRLSVQPSLPLGKTSAPVHGTFAAADALRLIIAGSGLQATQSSSGEWTLLTPESNPELEQVFVIADRQQAMVSRQGVETRDLPEAITIIPKIVLEESAARRYEDITYSTVGITPTVPFANATSSGGYSRGFNANLLVDGFTQGFAGLISGLGIVDRVEVLRGPTSVLYGQGDPGGSVNLVLKRPLPQFGFTASATTDDLGTRLLDLDLTGPIVSDKLAFRIVGEGEYSDTFRDFEKNRRVQIAPMLSVEPWSGGKLDVLTSFDRYDYSTIRQFSYYTGFFPISLLEAFPVSRNLSEPTLPLSRLDTRILNTQFVQRIGDSWMVTASMYDYLSENEAYYEIRTLQPIADDSTVYSRQFVTTTSPGLNQNRSRNYALRLNGEMDIFGTHNKMLFGAERLTNVFSYNDVIGDYLPIDIDNPTYQSGFVEPTALEPNNVGGQTTTTNAAYANDLVSLGSNWKVQLGVRFDHISSTGYGDVSRDTIVDNKVSPSLGVVWEPSDSTAIYSSYSTAFVPQIGRDKDGAALKPERSTAYEVGIKQEVFDKSMAVTLAVFTIIKNDIVQTDPTDPDDEVNGGKARSQGFELEWDGRTPIPGLSFRGGLAYANTRIYDSTDFPTGTHLVGPRPWTALLSARQGLTPFGIDGGWVSASAYYGGRAEAAAPSDGEMMPSFTRVDLAAGKAWGRFEFQINLKNLLNQRIFVSNGGGLLIFDNPRSVGASLTYRMRDL